MGTTKRLAYFLLNHRVYYRVHSCTKIYLVYRHVFSYGTKYIGLRQVLGWEGSPNTLYTTVFGSILKQYIDQFHLSLIALSVVSSSFDMVDHEILLRRLQLFPVASLASLFARLNLISLTVHKWVFLG